MRLRTLALLLFAAVVLVLPPRSTAMHTDRVDLYDKRGERTGRVEIDKHGRVEIRDTTSRLIGRGRVDHSGSFEIRDRDGRVQYRGTRR